MKWIMTAIAAIVLIGMMILIGRENRVKHPITQPENSPVVQQNVPAIIASQTITTPDVQSLEQLVVRIFSVETLGPIEDAHVSLNRQVGKKTDEEGQVTFEEVNTSGQIMVQAQGYVPYDRQFVVQNPTLEIFLEPAGGFRGTVTSPEGVVINAKIITTGEGRGSAESLTDQQGFFHVKGLPLDRSYTLRVYAEGFQTQYRTDLLLTRSKPWQDLKFELKPDVAGTVNIRGWVLDAETERPVSNAMVALRNYINGDQADTMTDEEGYFEFSNAPSRAFRLIVTADEYAPAARFLNEKSSDLVMMLERGSRVEGTVVDPDGAPLADVSLTPITGFQELYQEELKTDRQGRWMMAHVSGRLSVKFEKEGYAAKTLSLFRVAKDGTSPIVVLHPTTAFHAQIVDAETGSPVTDFEVTLTNWDPQFRTHLTNRREPVRVQHPDGRFMLKDMPDSAVIELNVAAPDFAPRRFKGVLVDGRSKTLELFAALDSLYGGVRDQSGKTRADVLIQIYGLVEGVTLEDWNGGTPLSPTQILFSRETKTDQQGLFSFDDLAADTKHTVVVSGAGLVRKLIEPVYPQRSETEGVLWITADEEAMIYGQINREMFPTAFSLHALTEGLVTVELQLQPDQTYYELGGLGKGMGKVSLIGNDDNGGVSVLLDRPLINLEAGERREIDFDLVTRTIKGTAFYDGRPMIQEPLYLATHRQWWKAYTDAEGRFEFEPMERGIYVLLVPWVDAPEALGEAHLMKDYPNQHLIFLREHVDERFDFQRMGDLTGRLIALEENQNGPWRIWVRGTTDYGPLHERRTNIDANGAFRVPRLPPGRYELGRFPANNPSDFERLVDELIMPSNGSDVDLGDLYPLGEAPLLVRLTGDQPVDWRFRVSIDYQGGANGADVVRDLYRVPDHIQFNSLPDGPATIRVQAADSRAFNIGPLERTLNLSPDRFSEAVFTVSPTTFLSFATNAEGPGIAEIRLISAQGVVEGSLTSPQDPSAPHLVFQSNGGFAKNFQAGAYTLEAISDNGRTLRQRIMLALGRETEVPLIFP